MITKNLRKPLTVYVRLLGAYKGIRSLKNNLESDH